MRYSDKIKSNAEFIGKLVFSKDKIKFVTHHINSSGRVHQKYFRTLGDVVYFFFIDNKLMKIGKAAGGSGWYQRMMEYTKARYNKHSREMWDATTRKIYNYMDENKQKELQVYVMKSPRILTEMHSLVTGAPCIVEIETAEDNEQILIQEAMINGEDLPFCREVLR